MFAIKTIAAAYNIPSALAEGRGGKAADGVLFWLRIFTSGFSAHLLSGFSESLEFIFREVVYTAHRDFV